MRWNNKGNEFDSFIDEWPLENEYYVWGASTIGKSFYKQFNNLIKIKGFIDNDTMKQNKNFFDKMVYSIEDLLSEFQEVKIIVASGAYSEISEQLKKFNLKEGIDFCDSRVFEGVYFVYKYNKLHIYRTDLSITSKCNLNCKKCNMLMPYYKNPKHRSFEEIKEDIDILFKWIDNLKLFNILGGEPFLHPNINEIIEYIGENYYKKSIEHIEFFSNGTVKLSYETLELCKKYDISIQVSDYSNKLKILKERVDDFVSILSRHSIEYRRNINEEWLDFGNTGICNDKMNEEEMTIFFDKCYASFRGLYNQKFYYCHLNTSAVQCGIFKEDENNYFDLTQFDDNKKIQFLEFDLGYNNKGYLSYCRNCNGCFSVNEKYVEAAEQIERKVVK